MVDRRTAKPVIWLVDTRTTLKSFPQEVQVVSDHRGDTFRGVYTVRFADAVYVLHVFQKKSKKAIATPKADVELIRQRLKRAAELHHQREKE